MFAWHMDTLFFSVVSRHAVHWLKVFYLNIFENLCFGVILCKVLEGSVLTNTILGPCCSVAGFSDSVH